MIKKTTAYSALLFVFLLTACEETASSDTVENEVHSSEPVIKTEKVIEATATVALAFEGKITTNESKTSILKVDIYEKGSTSIFQTLEGLELPYESENSFYDTPTFEDLNFDGIPDLRLPESVGNANVYYAYWIYNKSKNSFEKNTEMTLSLPKVNAEKQEIMSFERNSAASYIETTYTYQEGKFITTRIENKEYVEEGKYQSVVQERQEDGTMKEIQNELVEEKE